METLAWTCAMCGFLLGGVLALVPGFPGCAVSLLGVIAFGALTDFRTLPPQAMALAALFTLLGAVSQLAAPAWSSRAMGGAAGVATGAIVGAALGVMIPMPGAAWVISVLCGAAFGLVAGREGATKWIRGVLGAAGGCVTGAALDLLATLALAALLAFADFLVP
jgi:uncharacterized protein YqgC (DUF456 family)